MIIVFAKELKFEVRLRLTLRKGFLTQLGISCLNTANWQKFDLNHKEVTQLAQIILHDYPGLELPIPCANGFIFQFDPEEFRLVEVPIEDLETFKFWVELRLEQKLGLKKTTHESEREYS